MSFQELKGVALDSLYLYLADSPGSIYAWSGIPVAGNEPPLRTISVPGFPLNHLNSDGTCLCVTVQAAQPSVYVYRVADIARPGTPQPYKTIVSSPALRLNLPAEALTFNGGFAIANTSNNAVYLWRNLDDAGDTSRVTVLGQSSLGGIRAAIGINRLFMPASLLFYQNRLWVGELKFSSRILQYTVRTAQSAHEAIEVSGCHLSQNYPNPFNPTTTIKYDLPVDSRVSLKIFDVIGQEVVTLVKEDQKAGYRSAEWDASNVASGVYFYRLEARPTAGEVG